MSHNISDVGSMSVSLDKGYIISAYEADTCQGGAVAAIPRNVSSFGTRSVQAGGAAGGSEPVCVGGRVNARSVQARGRAGFGAGGVKAGAGALAVSVSGSADVGPMSGAGVRAASRARVYRDTCAEPLVAVLCCRRRSVYKTFGICDCYDVRRDARSYRAGGVPVVAHPPCRQWGRLRGVSTRGDACEKALGPLCVEFVRSSGGVLEHPAYSTLWAFSGLPRPGAGPDAWGGWTMPVLQFWWGHRAYKATWLYVVGCPPGRVPVIPLRLGYSSKNVCEMDIGERERTPEPFARWLVELACRCRCGWVGKTQNERAVLCQVAG